jgi:Mismatch repair ATPase (MutS family)
MSAYGILAVVLAVVAAVIIGTNISGMLKKRKLVESIRLQYGKKPKLGYEEDDFEHIPDYYLYRLAHGAGFTIDDITWNDLNLDGIFVDINATQTSCGEQALYNILRTPIFDRERFDRRARLVHALEQNEALRVKLQSIFAGLSKWRTADICGEFKPDKRGVGAAVIYSLLSACLILSLIYTFISPLAGGPLLVLFFIVNAMVYAIKTRGTNENFIRLNYMLSMTVTAKKLEKLAAPEILENTAQLAAANKKLRGLASIGTITFTPQGAEVSDLVSMILLWDLIRFEIAKVRLGAQFDALMTVFEVIGELDGAISIASFGRRLHGISPQIDFDGKKASLCAQGLVHPQIEDAVPNNFDAGCSMLLTGSNASGKSTYLKTVAVNAIFAQTLCLCLAQSYKASALRVYSSMALRDDLASGESYYIVEIRSIGRIVTAGGESGAPVLCIVDEVLRGTNTVERIAASSEILRHIAAGGALCVAATHDIELASILAGDFRNFHFQESIAGGAMKFDYRLREGPSQSRNAIRLLELMGYDKSISQNASRRAEDFLKNGKWQ